MQSNDQYENLSSSGLRFTLLFKSLEETLLLLYQLASLRAKAAAICEAEVPRGARDLGLSDACWDLGLPDVALDCRGPLDCGADAAHICVRDHASTGRSTCRRHAHKLVTHAHTQRHTHTQAWKHTHMHAHTHTRTLTPEPERRAVSDGLFCRVPFVTPLRSFATSLLPLLESERGVRPRLNCGRGERVWLV